MTQAVISSRTPEGRSGRCPVCRNRVCIEPSSPTGDAPCPSCGHLIFFVGRRRPIRHSGAREVGQTLRKSTRRLAGLVENVARRAVRAVRDALQVQKQDSGTQEAPKGSPGVRDRWLDG